MADFLFDIRGNISPYGPVKASLADIEEMLVTPFPQPVRQRLFADYLRYTTELRALIERPFYQWLNGSFSQNTVVPKDIDIVSFIDYETYTANEQYIAERFDKWTVRTFYPAIDAYTVRTYPADHKSFLTFQADEAYWNNWFSRSRRDRYGNRYPKGFIHIDVV